MQGRAQRVIYGLLKCTESQRLKPSQRHSRDSALPRRVNMVQRSHTPALAIALSSPYLDSCHAGFICLRLSGEFPTLFRGHSELVI